MDYTAFYQPGVPATITPPTDSLSDMFDRAVGQAKNRVALDFFGRTTTYSSLGHQVARAAEGLRQLGVVAGDRVALILPNCPQHIIAFYAVLRLGAVVVEHNPLYTARELRHMFEDHAARVVIAWDVAVDKLRQQPDDIELDHIVSVNLLTEFPALKRFALHLPLPGLRAKRRQLTMKARRTLPWEKLLHNKGLRPSHPRPRVGDVAVIQYTSGTTSVPKGAILTHRNLYSNALQGEAWMHNAQLGKENLYAVLPFFHVFGLTVCVTYAILTQARIHLFPTFDVGLVLAAAKKSPPTVLCAVPPIFDTLAREAPKRKVVFTSAHLCISGAMALPASTIEAWEALTGWPIVEGYGMTESSPITLGNPIHTTRKPGTVGLPFPSTEIKVVDPDHPATVVRQGERGELLVRGPQVFQGYWNNPAETARTLSADGWLATGDIVTQDSDGFVTIVDRKKELIITSGFNVAPTEVESVLKAHPDIADAVVVGLPHGHSGEEVVAAVTLDPGCELDVREARAFCRARLAAYKVPRRLFVVEALPKSLLGKALRREVREQLLAE
ncbi:MAG: AMP-binding protein [Propionibacteriaceae bacterium]|jgi:long-chain acyl-CoA synthetase|nr:AMP-binding protein [Propionibacteriaceae bacterium]